MDGISLDDVAPATPASAPAAKPAKSAGYSLDDVAPAPAAAPEPKYETALTPREEVKFTSWKQQNAPKDSGADYDLRGAFKAGLTPDAKTGHWPDTYKKPNHPTFSDQSQYAKDAPERAGTWNGDTYVPPQPAAPAGYSLEDIAPEDVGQPSQGFAETAGGAATGRQMAKRQPATGGVTANFDASKQPAAAEQPSTMAPLSAEKYRELQNLNTTDPAALARMAKKAGVLGDAARQIIGEPAQAETMAKAITPRQQSTQQTLDAQRKTLTDWRTRMVDQKPEILSYIKSASPFIDDAAAEETYRRWWSDPRKLPPEVAEDYFGRKSNLNPLERGVATGMLNLWQGAQGSAQAISDALGTHALSQRMRDEEAGTEATIDKLGRSPAHQGLSGALKRDFESVVSSIVQQAPTLAAGMAFEVPQVAGSLGMMGLQSFGQEYANGTRKGLRPSEAADRASIFASFEVVGELFGFPQYVRAMKTAMSGVPTKALVGELAHAITADIPGEQLTTLGQFLADKDPHYGLNPQATFKDYMQQVKDTLTQTVMQGGIMGGGAMALHGGHHLLHPDERSKQFLDEWAVDVGAQPMEAEVATAAPHPHAEHQKDVAALSSLLNDERPTHEIIADRAAQSDAIRQDQARAEQERADADRASADRELADLGVPPAGSASILTWPDGAQHVGVIESATPSQVVFKTNDGETYTVNPKDREADFAPALTGDGTPSNPIVVSHMAHVEEAAKRIDEARSWPQITAGNDRKGHIEWHGIPITLEVGKGDVRESHPDAPQQWSIEMPHAYGYVKGTDSADGEEADVAVVGMHPTAHVFDTLDTDTGAFDEHKTILGAGTIRAATQSLRAMYDDNADGRIGGVVAMSIPEYRAWLKTDAAKRPVIFVNRGISLDEVEDATPARQEQSGGEQQHSGTASGEHVPENGGEVREVEGAQAVDRDRAERSGQEQRAGVASPEQNRGQERPAHESDGKPEPVVERPAVSAEPVKPRPELSRWTIQRIQKAAKKQVERQAAEDADRKELNAGKKLTSAEIRKAAGRMQLTAEDIEIVRLIDEARVTDPALLNKLSNKMLGTLSSDETTPDDYIKALKEIINGTYEAAPQKIENDSGRAGADVGQAPQQTAERKEQAAERGSEPATYSVDDIESQRATFDAGKLVADNAQSDRRTTQAVNGLGDEAQGALKFSLGKPTQTNTPEFKKWFGDSKVVDKDDRPLVVYRGGRPGKTVFTGREDSSNYIQGNIFFSSEAGIAKGYTPHRTNSYISSKDMNESHGLYATYLKIENPIVIDAKGEAWDGIPLSGALKKQIKAGQIQIDDLALHVQKHTNNDGLIVRNVTDQFGEGDQYVVFKPEQIKSAIGNAGTFDEKNPDIRFSLGRPGDKPPYESEKFKAWFGSSILKDRNGVPVTLYHGTQREFDAFDKQQIGKKTAHITSGLGFFFSPSQSFAKKYAGDTGRVLSFYVNLKQPFIMPYKNTLDVHTHEDAILLRARLVADGYDGIIVPKNDLGFKGYVIAFEPTSIKSTDNFGNWSSNDERFRYSRGLDDVFYSALARAIDNMPLKSASAAQWKASIKNLVQKGIKQMEIDATGINDWLDLVGADVPDGSGTKAPPVSKENVVHYLKANGVQVHETTLEGDATMDIHVDEFTVDDPDDEYIRENAKDFHLDDAINDIAVEKGIPHEDVDKDDAMARAVQTASDAYYDDPQFSSEATAEFLGKTYNFRINSDGREIDIWIDDGKGESIYQGKRLDEPEIEAEIRAHILKLTGREEGEQTKFHEWKLPGGDDYKELLLTLPLPEGKKPEALTELPEGYEPIFDRNAIPSAQWGVTPPGQIHARPMGGRFATKEEAIADALKLVNNQRLSNWVYERNKGTFNSSHFDQPNILAHVRFDTRKDADGKSVLFVEEFQSDWAQKGKKAGFKTKKNASPGLPSKFTVEQTEHQYIVTDPASGMKVDIGKGTVPNEEDARQYANRYFWGKVEEEETLQIGRFPEAPFVTKTEAWVGLLMKRMIRYAAENGFDRVAWATGAQNAGHYRLSSHVDSVEWHTFNYDDQSPGGKTVRMGKISVHMDAAGVIDSSNRSSNELSGKHLSDVIGKELAEKVMASDKGELTGLDLDVGGEGMKQFYDKIVPNVANDVLKKLGGERVINITLPSTFKGKDSTGRTISTGRTEQEARLNGGQGSAGEVAENKFSQMGFDITPKLKETALGGIPLFSRGAYFSDRYKANQAEITKRVMALAKQIAPSAHLKVVEEVFASGAGAVMSGAKSGEKIEAAGYYDSLRDLITVALRYDNPAETLRHESFHHLRNMGLIDDAEWDVLAKQSKAEWMGKYGVPDVEEGIAYAFGDYRGGAQYGGRVARIFAKIREFLQRLANLLHGMGFQTWEDVFAGIESGKVGRRGLGEEAPVGELSRAALARDQTDSAAFKKWFGDSKVVDADGRPLVVYHGTNASFDKFNPSLSGKNHGLKEPGIYFTSDPVTEASGQAQWAARKEGAANIMPVYVSLQNPLIIEQDSDGEGEFALIENKRGLLPEILEALNSSKYDGVIARDTGTKSTRNNAPFQIVIALNPTQIKSAIGNRGTFDTKNADIRYSLAPKGKAFKTWFTWDWNKNQAGKVKSKVVDDDGKPLPVYHATVNDFNSFDSSKANPESDWGAGFYFTNTPEDAEHNYAGFHGADLTLKIERAAERIVQDHENAEDRIEELPNGKFEAEFDREIIGEFDTNDAAQAAIDKLHDLDMETAKGLARAQLAEHEGATMQVFLSLTNPLIFGGDKETYLTYDFPNMDEESDDYDPNAEPTGTLVDLLDALRQASTAFNDTDRIDEAIGEVHEKFMEGGRAKDVLDFLRGHEGLIYATDDVGDSTGHELLRRAIQRAGFDGIIDYEVNKKFGSQADRTQKMKGMDYDTVHYIAFIPAQIKSAIGNNGTFNPNEGDVRYSLGAEKAADDASKALVRNAPIEFEREPSPFGTGRLADDINWLTKFAVHPRTIATMNKDFAPVYLAAVHQFEHRDEIAAGLQREATPYFDLPRVSKERVNAVLELGRLTGTVYGTGTTEISVTNDTGRPDALLRPGDTLTLTDREKAGYWAIRRAMDKALTMFKAQVIKEWGLDPATITNARQVMDALPAGASDAETARYQQAAMLVREIDEARKKGYVPFNRQGQVGILVRDAKVLDDWEVGGEQGERPVSATKHFELVEVDSLLQKAKRALKLTSAEMSKMPEVAARVKALKEQFPGMDIRVSQVSPNAPLAGGVQMTDLDMLASVAQINDQAWQEVRAGLQSAIQQRGFRKHFFGSQNVPGYSQDFERSLADYIVGISGYLARRDASPIWDEAISNIPTEKPALLKYAQDYRSYANNPVEEFASLRQAAFFYYLAGVPSTAMVNATQVAMFTAPYLTQFANPAKVSLELAAAYKDAATMLRFGSDVFNPANAPEDVKDEFQQAWDEGFFVPVTTYEMMGLAHNRMPALRHMAKKARQTLDTVSYLFNAAERTNRVVTFIASVRLAKEKAFAVNAGKVLAGNALARTDLMRDFTPAKFAEFVIDETHFRMGKVNRPQAMRGAGAALLQFKGFSFQSIELLYRLANQNGRQGKKALVLILLMLMMTSGLWGEPFVDDITSLIEFLYKRYTDTDLDIKTEVREMLYELTGSAAVARAITDGALSQVVGVDVGKRIGLGTILPHSASDIGGVPLSLTAGKLGQSLDYAQRGQGMLALAEIMPNFIKNPMTAYEWGEEGIKSQSTGKVFMAPENVTTADQAKKAIGFTPEGLANVREAEFAVKRAEHAVDQLRSDYYAKLATLYAKAQRADDAGRTKDAIELELRADALYTEIDKFNEGRADHEQVRIDQKALQARTREELFGFEQRKGKEKKQARDRAEKIRQVYGTEVAGTD